MYDRPPASDDAEVEDLLRDGLGDVAERAGRRFHAGARGGSFGAMLSARLLPVRRHEDALELPLLPPAEAVLLAQDVLNHHGHVVWTREQRVRGVIGAGAMNMNPAVVDVDVRPGGRLVVRAAGKEGLIPQRTAQKAVRKVIESLELAARSYSAAPPS